MEIRNFSVDIGFLFDFNAQPLNFLKTDYDNDPAMAQQRALGLVAMIEKCRYDLDAGNSVISPLLRDGGTPGTGHIQPIVFNTQGGKEIGLISNR